VAGPVIQRAADRLGECPLSADGIMEAVASSTASASTGCNHVLMRGEAAGSSACVRIPVIVISHSS